MTLTVNPKEFDHYRELTTYTPPEALHETIDDLFRLGAWDVKISPLVELDPAEPFGKDNKRVTEYMLTSTFGSEPSDAGGES